MVRSSVRCDRCVQAADSVTSGIGSEPFYVCSGDDRLTDELRQEWTPATMMFADVIVICSDSREQLEVSLE